MRVRVGMLCGGAYLGQRAPGSLGPTAGAGVFAPGEKRERRCELLKRD